MRKFECKKCGCKDLAYHKYVKCVGDVNMDNGNCVYEISIVDEDDYLPAECGYVCQECGHPLRHWGRWIETEDELMRYLTADPEILAEEERQYEEHEAAVAEELEKEEQENISCEVLVEKYPTIDEEETVFTAKQENICC